MPQVTLRRTSIERRQYRGRRGPQKTALLSEWEVVVDGQVVGYVERSMRTREVGPAARRYVTARWESPGWTGGTRRYDNMEYRSRVDALEHVLHAALRVDWGVAEELAANATLEVDHAADQR